MSNIAGTVHHIEKHENKLEKILTVEHLGKIFIFRVHLIRYKF